VALPRPFSAAAAVPAPAFATRTEGAGLVVGGSASESSGAAGTQGCSGAAVIKVVVVLAVVEGTAPALAELGAT
jgi:hypothetical protein